MNSSLEHTDGIRNESRQVTQHTSPSRQEDIDDPSTAEGSPAGSINFQAMAPMLQHSDGGTPEGSSGYGAFTQQRLQQSDDFINDLVEDLNNGRTTAPRVGHNKSDTDEGEGKSSDKECSDNDDDEDELMNQLYAAASRDSDIDVNKTVGKGKNQKPSNRDDPPSSGGGSGSSSAESEESSSDDESDSDEDDDASDTTPMKKKKPEAAENTRKRRRRRVNAQTRVENPTEWDYVTNQPSPENTDTTIVHLHIRRVTLGNWKMKINYCLRNQSITMMSSP